MKNKMGFYIIVALGYGYMVYLFILLFLNLFGINF